MACIAMTDIVVARSVMAYVVRTPAAILQEKAFAQKLDRQVEHFVAGVILRHNYIDHNYIGHEHICYISWLE